MYSFMLTFFSTNPSISSLLHFITDFIVCVLQMPWCCFVQKRLKFWCVEALSWTCTLCREALSMTATRRQTWLYDISGMSYLDFLLIFKRSCYILLQEVTEYPLEEWPTWTLKSQRMKLLLTGCLWPTPASISFAFPPTRAKRTWNRNWSLEFQIQKVLDLSNLEDLK